MGNAKNYIALLRTAIDQGNKDFSMQLIGLLETEVIDLESQSARPGDNGSGPTQEAGQGQEEYDPRDPNCRFHSPDNEPVTGVWLTYHPVKGAKYKLENVRLVNEYEAGGRHFITVLQPDGLQVALATGYQGNPDRFDAAIPHSPGADLILDGHGEPPNLGPYAVYLMDGQGNRVSDVIASFMLPRGHHVCYVCKFKRA